MSTLHGNHLGNDYVARQFDPTLGRFLQADSIVPNPANPQSLNRYSYTLGNPLRYTDPSGHYTDDEILEWLKAQNPDNWESIWQTWQQDVTWMDWLHNAQFGDFGAYFRSDGTLQWFMFGRLLYGGWLDSLYGDPHTLFSLVDLYAADSWATGILRRGAGGGFDVISTDRGNQYLHIQAYVAVENQGRAFKGHLVRAGTMALFSIAIAETAGWAIGWSPLAEAAWQALIGEKAFNGLVVGGSWLFAEAADFSVPDHGCSIGDEAIYLDVLWGHGYYASNGRPLWVWWGGR